MFTLFFKGVVRFLGSIIVNISAPKTILESEKFAADKQEFLYRTALRPPLRRHPRGGGRLGRGRFRMRKTQRGGPFAYPWRSGWEKAGNAKTLEALASPEEGRAFEPFLRRSEAEENYIYKQFQLFRPKLNFQLPPF